jgi:hypothetical protein
MELTLIFASIGMFAIVGRASMSAADLLVDVRQLFPLPLFLPWPHALCTLN